MAGDVKGKFRLDLRKKKVEMFFWEHCKGGENWKKNLFFLIVSIIVV